LTENQASTEDTIDVRADDPQAVDGAIEFLYNLDYSNIPPAELAPVNGHSHHEPEAPADGDAASLVNGNGTYEDHAGGAPLPVVDDGQSAVMHSPKTEEPADSLDDFLPKTPVKKKKKKGRKQSIVEHPAPPLPEAEAEVDPPAEPDEPAPQETVAPAPPAESVLEVPPNRLTTHAKLYSLSAKYGIRELQKLTLDKFESLARDEGGKGWDADDFLRSAKEMYEAPSVGEDGDKVMRRAVTGILFSHKELFDRPQIKELFRGLDLMHDFVMHLKEQGGW
jgi:hypothetical protein